MPFMKGPSPIRRTLNYLNSSQLILKPYVRIFLLQYNRRQVSHEGARDFVFWHLAPLQYKNPDVQVITFRELTPTPFIRVWLNSGRELLLDIDRQSKDDIYERVLRTLCKTPQELMIEKKANEIQENPTHFGFGCSRHCICEIPGQVPCPAVVPLPYTWRGKYKTAKLLFDSVTGSNSATTTEDDEYESDSGDGDGDHVVTNSSSKSTSARSLATVADPILLDAGYLGHEVVLVKNGLRICGSGGALGSVPLIQTKSFFEVKFQQDGIWSIGVALRNCCLDESLGSNPESWALRRNGELHHNNMCIGKLEQQLQEGDIIGVSYDHIELNFYINGVKGNIAFSNVRGTIFPALFVDDGAVLDAIFDHFTYPIPAGFDRLIREKSIL